MRNRLRCWSLALGLLAAAVGALGHASSPRNPSPPMSPRGVLLTPEQATPAKLSALKREGINALALCVDGGSLPAAGAAAERVTAAGLVLYYWLEIARSPDLADAHPHWMASLQGHQQWRRRFPETPEPADGEVVKVYPWVPIRYREAYDSHLARVREHLRALPPAAGVFLNGLQAAPSACGCGHTLCRWTPDYGPIRTASELPADAAARFVAAVRRLTPTSDVIPVWLTECEEHEMEPGAACDGVPCFTGICWYAWAEQLTAVARDSSTIAALVPYLALGRDGPRYGAPAGWVGAALASFAEMPPKRDGEAVPADRLVAVLQGWNVTPEQRQAQVRQAEQAGARGYLIAEMEILQDWEPRIVTLSPSPQHPLTPEHPSAHPGHPGSNERRPHSQRSNH
jgi:hypothetical protein